MLCPVSPGEFMRLRLVFLLMIATSCRAQMTLTPVKTECGKKCSGSFFLINNGLTPETFSIDIRTTHFSQSAQGPVMTPLDNATAKVSQSSGRISPKESRQIDFHVQCTMLPCQVSFISSFTQGHTKPGQVAIRVAVMHTVYSCEKQSGCRLATLQAAGVTPPEQRK
jgi:hypothetical protein